MLRFGRAAAEHGSITEGSPGAGDEREGEEIGMPSTNEEIVRQSWQHYLNGDLAASRRMFADTCVVHVAGFPETLDIEQYGQQGEDWLTAFPDFGLNTQDFIASDD
jgi:hypothetical protein